MVYGVTPLLTVGLIGGILLFSIYTLTTGWRERRKRFEGLIGVALAFALPLVMGVLHEMIRDTPVRDITVSTEMQETQDSFLLALFAFINVCIYKFITLKSAAEKKVKFVIAGAAIFSVTFLASWFLFRTHEISLRNKPCCFLEGAIQGKCNPDCSKPL